MGRKSDPSAGLIRMRSELVNCCRSQIISMATHRIALGCVCRRNEPPATLFASRVLLLGQFPSSHASVCDLYADEHILDRGRGSLTTLAMSCRATPPRHRANRCVKHSVLMPLRHSHTKHLG